MGLKFFRTEEKYSVYYPSEEATERARFDLKSASGRDRIRLLNSGKTNEEGKPEVPLGTWRERCLIACVCGWDEKALGCEFSVEALIDLEEPIQNFLQRKINDLNLTGLTTRAAEEGPAKENPSKPSAS